MSKAREYRCIVQSARWITPSVVELRVATLKPLRFEAGQFVALEVPGLPEPGTWKPRTVKRLYSLSSAPGKADGREFELCIKYQKGGLGSEFVKRLKAGDEFNMRAPFGDFVYDSEPSRSACFIATGTGIAPMRSIVMSEHFQSQPPKKALLLFGAPDAGEILYPGVFEQHGCEVVHALSRLGREQSPASTRFTTQFKGRVTDYLKSLPAHWNWHGTDFYLCGNGEMIREVTQLLKDAHGVSPQAIRAEAFGPSNPAAKVIALPQRATTKRAAA